MNSKRTKVVVFPVKNSDVFNGYADEKEIEAKFTTRVAFEAEVTKKIFPNSPDKLNEPGNYLFPEQWLTDDLFKKLIHECFENTYQIFFDNKEILVKKERIAFIKFFNVILALKLIQKQKLITLLSCAIIAQTARGLLYHFVQDLINRLR
ncbi:MAG: hypothetical protein HWD61_00660 [Parachlamydiaceae bacterium]|nr:MAG: hypothetical protein HWD61_00660 [Parachlamydiaceae bacterium]